MRGRNRYEQIARPVQKKLISLALSYLSIDFSFEARTTWVAKVYLLRISRYAIRPSRRMKCMMKSHARIPCLIDKTKMCKFILNFKIRIHLGRNYYHMILLYRICPISFVPKQRMWNSFKQKVNETHYWLKHRNSCNCRRPTKKPDGSSISWPINFSVLFPRRLYYVIPGIMGRFPNLSINMQMLFKYAYVCLNDEWVNGLVPVSFIRDVNDDSHTIGAQPCDRIQSPLW